MPGATTEIFFLVRGEGAELAWEEERGAASSHFIVTSSPASITHSMHCLACLVLQVWIFSDRELHVEVHYRPLSLIVKQASPACNCKFLEHRQRQALHMI